MKTQNGLDQLITDLVNLITSDASPAQQVTLIRKIIMDANLMKDTLKTDVANLKKAGADNIASRIRANNPPGVLPPISPIIKALEALIFLMENFGSDLGSCLSNIRNYFLVIIGDYKKSKDYYDAANSYNLSNPSPDFWFHRSDRNGSVEFNTAEGNYVVNTLPSASSAIYSNAEIYNNPYTDLLPQCVIASPFPAEKIINENELDNFVFDLFMNIPFAASHSVVFEARIKAENLKGGSRGWGFWNTDAVPYVGMKTAWFMQQQGVVNGQEVNQFMTCTFMDGIQYQLITTPLDENWHDYKIVLTEKSVTHFIDGKPLTPITGLQNIPNAPMAIHNWVDNAFFDFDNKSPDYGKKVLQDSGTPRLNYCQYMKIYTLSS